MPSPPVKRRAAQTGHALGQAAYTAPATPAQVSPAGLQRLAAQVGRQRQIRRDRIIICLRAAYSSIRRADELIADTVLLDATTLVIDALAADRAALASLDQLARFAGLEGEA
jgi:hypothetical protein